MPGTQYICKTYLAIGMQYFNKEMCPFLMATDDFQYFCHKFIENLTLP